jgi:hypothetical protein
VTTRALDWSLHKSHRCRALLLVRCARWHLDAQAEVVTAQGAEDDEFAFPAHVLRLHEPLPKVAALLEEAVEDLLRVNREIGRRTDGVGIFPNDRSLIRLAASVVIEQNDEWSSAAAIWQPTRWRPCSSTQREVKDSEEARELTAA